MGSSKSEHEHFSNICNLGSKGTYWVCGIMGSITYKIPQAPGFGGSLRALATPALEQVAHAVDVLHDDVAGPQT